MNLSLRSLYIKRISLLLDSYYSNKVLLCLTVDTTITNFYIYLFLCSITDVKIGRKGFEKRVVSQDLELWLSNVSCFFTFWEEPITFKYELFGAL